jgi:pilus assembly protein Flp/PilA
MLNIKSLLTEFVQDESGLTAVEYAIAGALVAGTLVLAFTQLGQAVENTIGDLQSAVES